MNATARPIASSQEGIFTRVRSVAIGFLFAAVLLIPRILRLRRNAGTWKAVRILLAVAGAGLVIVPLSIASSWVAAVVGLVLFVAAILLPPAKAAAGVADKAKELGALVVVNGGEYEPLNASVVPVQLFVGSGEIFVINSGLNAILMICVAEITSCIAAESQGRWILRLRWAEQTSDFAYRGVFAEHLARVAESTIRSVIRSPLPVLQETRAARA
jgi:hypothetical protein